jgi:prophage DNA circulation protein
MRDWRKALRKASFRGVGFWVEAETPEVGRRVAVHEVSGGERIVTEDMGRRAREVFVSVYLAGDYADYAGLAPETACAAPGASVLALPIDPPRLMHCLTRRRSRQKDRMGYMAYDLEFVEAGTGAGPATGGVNALREIFDDGVAEVAQRLAAGA